MSAVPVVIKWQGRKYDVEVDTSEDGSTFKMQLYSLTSVPPEKQKILVKGGQLRDDQDMSKLGLKPGQTIMMMGTVGELKAPTAESIQNESEAESKFEKEPAGLENLGNTCYMNSSIQMLKIMPEMQDALNDNGSTTSFQNLAGSLGRTYKAMDTSSSAYTPTLFLATLRQLFPQFAERSREGHGFVQQDADECWSAIISSLQSSLKTRDGKSWIENFMAGTTKSIMHCAEAPDEEPIESADTFTKLSCHISAKTNFMADGIKDEMREEITKHSPSLGRDATYIKESVITRLPKYLTVSFVRFYWKASIRKKAKIMRKVKFPFEFDAVDFCDEQLKNKLVPVRDGLREITKDREEKVRARKRAKVQLDDPNGAQAKQIDSQGVEQEQKDYNEQVAKLASSMDPELLNDQGCNASGIYDLVGIVSHQGPSADSGHYLAWIKQENSKDWYLFNDENVSVVDEGKIEQLEGGGESASAYIMLYRARDFPRSQS